MIDYNRFLFKFTGKEEEINLLGDGTAKPEFKVWSWMLPEQVIEHVSFFWLVESKLCLELVGLTIRFFFFGRLYISRDLSTSTS